MTQEFKHVFYSHAEAAEKRRSALAIARACLRDVYTRRSADSTSEARAKNMSKFSLNSC